MTFKEYLQSKKIDPKTFHAGDADMFMEWKNIFEQVSPKSFTQQKLFLINKTRRQYPFVEKPQATSSAGSNTPKVKIPGKRAIKIQGKK